VHYNREYFVSAPDQALTVHLTASIKAAVSFTAGLSSPHKKYTITPIDKNTILLSLQVRNGALKGKSYMQVKITGGSVAVQNGKLIIDKADEATLYITAGTNYKNYRDVSADPAAPCTRIPEMVFNFFHFIGRK
jgi:alpha-L-fucosidase 2